MPRATRSRATFASSSAAPANPFAPPYGFRPLRMVKKAAAGQQFALTQMIFNVERFAEWMSRVRDEGIHEQVHILAGVGPLKSARMAEFMKFKVAGMEVPDAVMQRMRGARKPRTEGIRICLEIIEQVREIEGVHGVHVMAIDWEKAVPRIVKAAGLELPRPTPVPALAPTVAARARRRHGIAWREGGAGATIEEFAAALASDLPTPGGGSAAAAAVALGAALVAMSARLTLARKRYRSVHAEMQQIVDWTDATRADALTLIKLDANAYVNLLEAYRMPSDSKTGRAEAIGAAALAASRVPALVGDLALEVIDLAHTAVTKANPHVRSDAAGGRRVGARRPANL